MKILVTGSSGFIGHHLIKKLLSDGYSVVGIDNMNDYYCQSLKRERNKLIKSKKYKLMEYDLNDIDQIQGASDFELVINLAAQAGVRVSREQEYLYEHSNVKGFKSLCNFCADNGIKKIIYASSSSVYSDNGKNKFVETQTNLSPKSLYGKSKLSNEELASKLVKNMNIDMIGLRFFSVYGPLGRPDMAYYSFTNALKKQEVIKLNNSGAMFRDMTFIDDIVSGILKATDYIFKKNTTIRNEIFNLGNESPIETIKLLETLEQKLKKETKIEIIETKNELFRTHADIGKAKNLLGYDPKVSFEDGIDEFLKWHAEYEKI